MISLIVSAISVVIVMTVTVYIITKSYKDNSERNKQLTKIVDQINAVNSENVNIDVLQNRNFLAMNSNIISASNDISNIRRDYVTKASLASDVTSAKGSFNTLKIGGTNISGSSASNITYLNLGFDSATGALMFGSNVTVGNDANGNALFSASSDKQINIFTGTNAASGVIVNNNLVGIGAAPKTNNGTLQVSGALWSSQGLATTDNNTYASVISYSNNAIQMNPNKSFTGGVRLGPLTSMNNDSNVWLFDTSVPTNDNKNLVISRADSSTTGNGRFTFENTGRLNLTGEKSGITVKGGITGANISNASSLVGTELPGADGINRIQGDLTLNGNIMGSGDLRLSGSGANAVQFGVAREGDNRVRLYAGNTGSVNLSVMNNAQQRTFSDIVTVNNQGVSITGNLSSQTLTSQNITSTGTVFSTGNIMSERAIVSKSSGMPTPNGNGGWIITPNTNNELVFANIITGNPDNLPTDVSGAARINSAGRITANSLCLGNTCITADDLATIRQKSGM